MYGISLICGVASLIFVLSAGAQETGPTESPTAEVFTATPDSVLPTDTPTLLPLPSETPAPTEASTDVSPTLDPTETPTSGSPTPPPLTPSETAVSATPLPLTYQANFDTVYPAELSAKTGWIQVAVASGQALQADAGAVAIVYKPAVFVDVAVEAHFLLNAGEGLIKHGLYAAGLKSDGTVSLYYDQMLLVSNTISLTSGAWSLLRLESHDQHIQVSVNGVLILDYAETNTIPEGQVGFAASAEAALRVDDFAVYGTLLQPAQTPTDQPTETATAQDTATLTEAPSQIQRMPAGLKPPIPREVFYAETGYPMFTWEPVTAYLIEINDVCGDGSVTYQEITSNVDSFQVPSSAACLPQGSHTYCLKTLGAGDTES